MSARGISSMAIAKSPTRRDIWEAFCLWSAFCVMSRPVTRKPPPLFWNVPPTPHGEFDELVDVGEILSVSVFVFVYQ